MVSSLRYIQSEMRLRVLSGIQETRKVRTIEKSRLVALRILCSSCIGNIVSVMILLIMRTSVSKDVINPFEIQHSHLSGLLLVDVPPPTRGLFVPPPQVSRVRYHLHTVLCQYNQQSNCQYQLSTEKTLTDVPYRYIMLLAEVMVITGRRYWGWMSLEYHISPKPATGRADKWLWNAFIIITSPIKPRHGPR